MLNWYELLWWQARNKPKKSRKFSERKIKETNSRWGWSLPRLFAFIWVGEKEEEVGSSPSWVRVYVWEASLLTWILLVVLFSSSSCWPSQTDSYPPKKANRKYAYRIFFYEWAFSFPLPVKDGQPLHIKGLEAAGGRSRNTTSLTLIYFHSWLITEPVSTLVKWV